MRQQATEGSQSTSCYLTRNAVLAGAFRMQLAFSYPLDLPPDEAAQAAPDGLGVIRIDLEGGQPYVGQARNLRRRIARLQGLFGDRVVRIAFQPAGSSFEARVVLWGAAREAWPQDYREKLRLRCPALVKTLQNNRFPRIAVTSRIRGAALYYGPFRSRVFAEHFQDGLLDFFQVRRCSENLEPSPEHPGCVFGEIGKCMRPCQRAVGDAEYRSEFGRLLSAMESRGESLAGALEQQRNSASEQLHFELAKGLHEKALAARKLFLASPEAADLDHWHGLIVQKGAERNSISLLPVYGGYLQPKIELQLQLAEAGSLDQRLREALENAVFQRGPLSAREDSMAIVSRWLFSSWKDGEFLRIESFEKIPYRKLVNAVSRVSQGRRRA
jgi:hypothetical protein